MAFLAALSFLACSTACCRRRFSRYLNCCWLDVLMSWIRWRKGAIFIFCFFGLGPRWEGFAWVEVIVTSVSMVGSLEKKKAGVVFLAWCLNLDVDGDWPWRREPVDSREDLRWPTERRKLYRLDLDAFSRCAGLSCFLLELRLEAIAGPTATSFFREAFLLVVRTGIFSADGG